MSEDIKDYANLSDDDFMNSLPEFDENDWQETADETGSDTDDLSEMVNQEEYSDPAATDADDESSEASEEGEASEEQLEDTNPSEDADSDTNTDDSDQDQSTDEDAGSDADFDYEAAYKRLMGFKANGKDVELKSEDEALRLQQMGANYVEKMSALKPVRKIAKMLENNGLLDEQKLSFLIDLDKKDPGAIRQLIKDSGIDPLDMTDTDDNANYKPSTYTVDDRELALDSVLESIQDTPSYGKTIDVVTNKWDESSKRVLFENPQVIAAINSQMENGIYDMITSEIERERMFGGLSGLSSIEAYRQVGDKLHAEGRFAQLAGNTGATGSHQAQGAQANTVKANAEKSKLKDRKKAASTTKSRKTVKQQANFNPLAMSDEEFEKVLGEQFS